MRIGVYLGSWSLTRLGGMGVYLQNLLRGVEDGKNPEHEICLIVDRSNAASALELGLHAPIITMDRPRWDDLSLLERRDAIRVRQRSYRNVAEADAHRAMSWSAAARQYLWGLDDAVDANVIDLLYFTIPPYLKWPRVPVVLTIHDLKHIHRPQDHSPADLAQRRRWTRVAQKSTLVYASYEHVRGDIERFLHVPREQTAVLPLAVPTELFEPALDAPLPASLDIPDRFALMPAQFWPHKNHACVIDAISQLRQRGLDVPVLCTGQNADQCRDHAEAMQRLAGARRVSDLIRQLGFVDRSLLRGLYRRARLVIAASLYEPGSFPVMEALAFGCPLVASRVTTIPETAGDAAIYFDPNSAEDLAGAIELLWTDDAKCAALREKGPRRLSRRSWTDVGRDWLNLCETAVGRVCS